MRIGHHALAGHLGQRQPRLFVARAKLNDLPEKPQPVGHVHVRLFGKHGIGPHRQRRVTFVLRAEPNRVQPQFQVPVGDLLSGLRVAEVADVVEIATVAAERLQIELDARSARAEHLDPHDPSVVIAAAALAGHLRGGHAERLGHARGKVRLHRADAAVLAEVLQRVVFSRQPRLFALRVEHPGIVGDVAIALADHRATARVLAGGPPSLGQRRAMIDDVNEKLPGQELAAALHRPIGVEHVLEVLDGSDLAGRQDAVRAALVVAVVSRFPGPWRRPTSRPRRSPDRRSPETPRGTAGRARRTAAGPPARRRGPGRSPCTAFP